MAVSSLFFAFLHFDLTALPVYLFAGMLLSLVLYMTRSSVAAMLVHLGYNLFGVLAQAGLSGYCRSTGNLGLLVVLLIALLLLSAAVFCGESARVLRRRARLRRPMRPIPSRLPVFPHFPPVSFCPPSDVPSSAPKLCLRWFCGRQASSSIWCAERSGIRRGGKRRGTPERSSPGSSELFLIYLWLESGFMPAPTFFCPRSPSGGRQIQPPAKK